MKKTNKEINPTVNTLLELSQSFTWNGYFSNEITQFINHYDKPITSEILYNYLSETTEKNNIFSLSKHDKLFITNNILKEYINHISNKITNSPESAKANEIATIFFYLDFDEWKIEDQENSDLVLFVLKEYLDNETCEKIPFRIWENAWEIIPKNKSHYTVKELKEILDDYNNDAIITYNFKIIHNNEIIEMKRKVTEIKSSEITKNKIVLEFFHKDST